MIPLTKWLFSKQITCIGTIQTNRKGLPKEIKEIKGREKNCWTAYKEEGGYVHLNSCVVKTKSMGMRNVLLLDTTEAAHYITNDEKKKQYTHIKYTILLKVVSTYPIDGRVPLLVSKKQEDRRLSH